MNFDFLFKKEWLFLLGAITLLAAAGVYFYLSRPTPLSVAVGPRDGSEARLMEAYAKALVDQKLDVKLKVEPFDDVRDSAEALRAKKVDLAVVRPDVLLPENGLTVALLRQEAAIVVAPQASKVTDMGGLARKKLGIVTAHEADMAFFTNLLGFYDLAPPAVTVVPLGMDEVEWAVSTKKVDAVAVLASPTGTRASQVVRAAARAAGDRKVAVVPIAETDALSQRYPALTAMTIPAGAFGGRPKEPEEEVKTIGVTYRLMARENLARTTVASVTEHLFTTRSRLALATSEANQLKSPDMDSAATATSAMIPNHPGAVDYYQREETSFMDRYGDWIWIILIFGGSLFSGFASIVQRLARKRREIVDVVLDRLMDILAEAREVKNVGELDELAMEIDRLVVHAVRYARLRAGAGKMMSALILAIDSARAAILDRRRDILDASTSLDRRAGEPPLEEVPRTVAAALAR